MSDERKMILQMLADGKISADEADTLLQAIEESERTAQETVVESAQRSERTADGLQGLGRIIDQSVKTAFDALDETFRSLEGRLENDEARQEQLKRRVEDRLRRSTERALERALQAEERAKRAAERAAARMQEQAERLAQRELERAERDARRDAERAERDAERAAYADNSGRTPKRNFIKTGIHIDRQSVQRIDPFTIPAESGDRFVLENRVGDVEVEFHDGNEIEVEAHKTVWGADEADANERADATVIQLARTGSEVRVEVERPSIKMVMGYLEIKDTRIDYKVRLPRMTHLQVTTKVGDIQVEGDEEITTWSLAAKVGDIDLTVPEDGDFAYTLRTRVGKVDIDLVEENAAMTQSRTLPARGEPEITGTYGDGRGRIEAKVATGDIRLHH